MKYLKLFESFDDTQNEGRQNDLEDKPLFFINEDEDEKWHVNFKVTPWDLDWIEDSQYNDGFDTQEEAQALFDKHNFADTIEHFDSDAATDNSEQLFKDLVPGSGKSSTQEGEFLRAIYKIEYRWGNDGDLFYENYGIETAGPSAAFLIENLEGKHEYDNALMYIKDAVGKTGDDYDEQIRMAKDEIVIQGVRNYGNYTNNDGDMFDYSEKATELFGASDDNDND